MSSLRFGVFARLILLRIVAIAATVIGTVMWQIPRRRRQRRQAQLAAEEGRSEGLQDGIRLAKEGGFQRVDEVSESLAKVSPALAVSLIDL